MTELIFFLLTVTGVGYLLTEASIFKPFRMFVSNLHSKKMFQPLGWILEKFDGVVNCIYCSSFWIGIIVYNIMIWKLSWWSIFYAFAAMGFIHVIKTLSK